ncbi:MAG: insulinase family protein [Magnetococcales bacterium]|nr:insulinase family protein [Magnetococcales bacterium]
MSLLHPSSTTTSEPDSIPDPNYQLSHLENGLSVATFPMSWLHEISVTILVRAGSRFESENESGIAHFLEHMLFKGTTNTPDPTQFHALIESMAADMNAATGHESNAYWISLPLELLQPGLSAFCEMFTQPVFSDMETEREVILAEMRDEENEQGECTNTSVLSGGKLWPNHPLARSILGSPEQINTLTKAHLYDYMKRQYRGGNMAIAFCGPIQHDYSLKLAAENLGQLPSGRTALPPGPADMEPGPHWVAVNDQDAQFCLNIFYRTGGYHHSDYYRIAALRRLLDDGFSSRLQANIREKQGLVYDVWASYTAFLECGCFELGGSVSPKNLDHLFDGLLNEMEKAAQTTPTVSEWQRLQTRWRASLLTQLDRPSQLIDRYVGDRLFDYQEPLSLAWEKARSIRPETLATTVRSLINAENMVVVLIGPKATSTLPRLKRLFQKKVHSKSQTKVPTL